MKITDLSKTFLLLPLLYTLAIDAKIEDSEERFVLPEVDAQGADIIYEDKVGKGFTTKTLYILNDYTIRHKDITVDIFKREKSLDITDGTSSVSIVEPFIKYIDYFDMIDLKSGEFRMKGTNFEGAFAKAHLKISGWKYTISNLTAACNGLIDSRPVSTYDALMHAFTNSTIIKADRLKFNKAKKSSVLDDITPTINEIVKSYNLKRADREGTIIDTVNNLSFSIDKNVFLITAYVKKVMKLKLVLAGDIHYEKESRILKIRIDKVKTGIISLKRRFFKTIKKLELKNLRVEPPYLYIDIADGSKKTIKK